MNFKEKIIIKRNADGNVLPVDYEIEIDGQKQQVAIVPIAIGEMNEFSQFKDENSPEAIAAATNLICRHYVDPSFKAEEIKDLKIGYIKPLVDGLLEVSGYQKKR